MSLMLLTGEPDQKLFDSRVPVQERPTGSAHRHMSHFHQEILGVAVLLFDCIFKAPPCYWRGCTFPIAEVSSWSRIAELK